MGEGSQKAGRGDAPDKCAPRPSRPVKPVRKPFAKKPAKRSDREMQAEGGLKYETR